MPPLKKSSAGKKNSWKDVQFKAKVKKRSKLALIILAAVAGLLVVSWAVKFAQSLFSPWKESQSSHKRYIWDGKFNINLIIHTNHTSLFSYNPKEEKIIIINIPDETFLEVPYGFGSWQLGSVYRLGQSQKELGGNRLLADTLTSFFGIPIDGFLDLNTPGNKKSAFEIVETLRKNPFSGFNLLSVLKTDLTMWELFKLKLGITSVRFDKIKELNLDQLNVFNKENLLDGTQILTADPIKLDSVLSDLADPTIVAEHKSIAVFNATDHPQLALKWARLITNLGGNIIITSNAKDTLEKTQIQGLDSATLKRLRQIFQLDCFDNPKCDKQSLPLSGEKGKINVKDLDSSRAQINVYLGEDYSNR
ncbi:LytR C-terminal domain-containing protein [Patescibacteria group bacterium]|nr:LytR C-terminal domain-containing protein [Patescibacteria group bacterium]